MAFPNRTGDRSRLELHCTPLIDNDEEGPKEQIEATWRFAKGATSSIAAAPTPVFGEVFAMRHRGQRVELIRPVRGRETVISGAAGSKPTTFVFKRQEEK